MRTKHGIPRSDPNQTVNHFVEGWLKTRIPLALLVASLIAFTVPTNETFIVVSLIGSLAGIVAAYIFIVKIREIRFSWLLADGILLGYALGAFNTCARFLPTEIRVAKYFARPQDELSVALAVGLCVAGLLFFLGSLTEPGIRIDTTKLRAKDLRWAFLIFLLTGIAFLTGGIGYMGVSSTEEHRVSVLGAVIGMLLPALPAFVVFTQTKCRSSFSRLMSWFLVVGSLMALDDRRTCPKNRLHKISWL